MIRQGIFKIIITISIVNSLFKNPQSESTKCEELYIRVKQKNENEDENSNKCANVMFENRYDQSIAREREREREREIINSCP